MARERTAGNALIRCDSHVTVDSDRNLFVNSILAEPSFGVEDICIRSKYVFVPIGSSPSVSLQGVAAPVSPVVSTNRRHNPETFWNG